MNDDRVIQINACLICTVVDGRFVDQRIYVGKAPLRMRSVETLESLYAACLEQAADPEDPCQGGVSRRRKVR